MTTPEMLNINIQIGCNIMVSYWKSLPPSSNNTQCDQTRKDVHATIVTSAQIQTLSMILKWKDIFVFGRPFKPLESSYGLMY